MNQKQLLTKLAETLDADQLECIIFSAQAHIADSEAFMKMQEKMGWDDDKMLIFRGELESLAGRI